MLKVENQLVVSVLLAVIILGSLGYTGCGEEKKEKTYFRTESCTIYVDAVCEQFITCEYPGLKTKESCNDYLKESKKMDCSVMSEIEKTRSDVKKCVKDFSALECSALDDFFGQNIQPQSCTELHTELKLSLE